MMMQSTRSTSHLLGFFLVVGTLFLPGVAGAVELGVVDLHGFGSWGVGWTDHNRYQFGSTDTDYDQVDLTLVTRVDPTEKVRIFTQLHFDATNLDSGTSEVETSVDYLLVEWKLANGLAFRLGRAHHVFGIYGENYRIGTLRPFSLLPQGIYGTAGMIGENFNGVALRGLREDESGRALRYDLYGGNIQIGISRPWIVLLDAEFDDTGAKSDVDEVFGLRLQYGREAGWRFGLSAYLGQQKSGSGGRVPEGDHGVIGAHAEYSGWPWQLRAEVARHDHLDALSLDGAYLELMRYFGEHWQLAARYDYADTEIDGFTVIEEAPSLWKHEDFGVAVSYWFTSALVVRGEVHRVDGNRFARPEDLATRVEVGTLSTESDLIQVSVQFSF